MDIQTEKLLLIEELARIEDARVIAEVRKVLLKENDPVVGYEINGQPITRKQLAQRVKEAVARIDAGEYITHEDLEKEAESW